jgi:beta-lactam-binding protein with PASTA domain
VRTVVEDTDDQTQDGIVVSQDPIGGTQADANATVTLFVGRFTGTTTSTDTGDTTTTPATTP